MVDVHDFKKLGGHMAVYGGTSVLRKVVGLLMLPVYIRLRLLTPADYGVLDLASVVTWFLTTAVLFQMPWSMSRFYLYDARSEEDKQRTLSTAATFLVIAVSVFGLVGLSLVKPISKVVFNRSGCEDLGILVVIGVMGSCLLNFRITHCRNLKQSGRFSAISLTMFVLSLVLTVLFVVVLRWGPLGALLGSGVALLVMCASFVPWFVRAVRGRFDWGLLKEMIKLGGPLIPGAMALWLLMGSDRFFVQRLLGPDQVGYYGVVNKLVLPAVFLGEAFRLAWNPLRYEHARTSTGPKVFGRTLTVLTFVFLAGVLALWVLGPPVIALLTGPDSGYGSAAGAIPFLGLSHFFNTVVVITGIGLILAKKTYYILLFQLLSLVVYVPCIFLLTPLAGMTGVAAARAIAFLVAAVGCTAASRKYYQVGFEWKRLAMLALVFVGLALLPCLPAFRESPLQIVFRCLIVVGYPTVLLMLGFLTPREKELLKDFARRDWRLIRTAGGSSDDEEDSESE